MYKKEPKTTENNRKHYSKSAIVPKTTKKYRKHYSTSVTVPKFPKRTEDYRKLPKTLQQLYRKQQKSTENITVCQ